MDAIDARGEGGEGAVNFGRGWIPQSRDIGLPGEDCEGLRALHQAREPLPPTPSPVGAGEYDAAPLDAVRWTADVKLRFLHVLSGHGNVRVAAAAVGLSRQGAYLARRRDARFARGWDGALVLARRHAEAVLAERAIDGTVEDIWFRGELVGTRRRYDPRLLLAHLARLDKAAASASGKEAEAGFDRLLGEIAGLSAVEDVAAMGRSRDAFLNAAILAAEVEEAPEDDGFEMPDWAVEMEEEERAAQDAALEAEHAARVVAEAEAAARWDAGWAALYQAVDGALEGCAAYEVKGMAEFSPWTVSKVSSGIPDQVRDDEGGGGVRPPLAPTSSSAYAAAQEWENARWPGSGSTSLKWGSALSTPFAVPSPKPTTSSSPR